MPDTMTDSILIHNCTLLTAPNAPLLANATLLTRGETIVAIGTTDTMQQADTTQATTIIDGQGKLLMPGLINAHNHCAMTLFRGMADDMELATWLSKYIFPAEARHVNKEMVYHCSKLAAAEMILSGTTTVADGYFFEGQAAQAFIDTGLRAIAAHGIIDFPAPGVPDPARNLETAIEFLDEWQGKQPRITPAIFAHSPYTCSAETLQRAKRVATERQVPFFIHVAESSQEQAMIQAARGTSPIRHLNALDLLDPGTICIHCVCLDEEDLALLAKTQAGVVVCPQSHLKLASGTAPVSAMIEHGIQVGLGTDGCASNNSLDMFREMDLLSKTQKLHTLNATSIPARQALTCATINNAKLLGLGNIGQLRPGYKADLILLDMQQPHLTPCYNQDLLVYGAGGADVHTVIIDGRMVMADKKLLTFDVQTTMQEVRRLASQLAGARH
ncbi:MAG: amidohydrolase [Desulfocapsa sp.]|nr:amidohydrolase [Desulfocapsa sp.]MBU3944148.1 amidohydrolase [Pseudomonadota bacterium]MBU3983525.1 amidohydrolase [Pseudomonadota bacterium]MBU4083074.1 amidohydrolase [Pseudomonadota bacterium]MBU4106202.1 amidohydrolase [Pseudomonadota bacterium]